MSIIPPLLLCLGMLFPAVSPESVLGRPDTARLREMLQDRLHPHQQSQAALLLVQDHSADADALVREGLRKTDSVEVFQALAAALRLSRDNRFTCELLAALASGPAPVRLAAADTLAVLADSVVLVRLQALVEDPQADLGARKAAVETLGRTGRKEAALVLLDQLSASEEVLRRAAADALAELTGQNCGSDAARWRTWWNSHKDLPADRWLEERLAYQANRSRRLEGDVERLRAQVVQLHQKLYARLPAADRLSFVQGLADREDANVRALAVSWSVELLATAEAVGQRELGSVLLKLSQDAAPEVQQPAVLALGRVDDPRAFEQLRRLLRHSRPPVRAAAAHALAQQASSASSETAARQRQVIPLLQKALEDPILDVMVAAAEGLGSLGIPEAGPVLTALLRHPSEPVRQTAVQALERIADPALLDGLLTALEDSSVTVRFGLVGALARAVGDGQALAEPQRARAQARLEELALRDTDPGVRSRAATVLGQFAPANELAFLWRRVQSREDNRVQDKAFAAMIEIVIRSSKMELLREWDQKLTEANQGSRRLQLLTEVCARWKKTEETKALLAAASELLVESQLEQGKWAAAFPLVRELLTRPGNDDEVAKRLRWLLSIGQLAMKEGNQPEVIHVVREAQPLLTGRPELAAEFSKLEKQAGKKSEQ